LGYDPAVSKSVPISELLSFPAFVVAGAAGSGRPTDAADAKGSPRTRTHGEALLLTAADGALVEIWFAPSGARIEAAMQVSGDPATPAQASTVAVLAATKRQLEEYFAGGRRVFDLPLAPRGTEFERQVWKALLDVPFGETRSYAEIAGAIARPAACRAVGRANGSNPIPIIIPCHRIIGADGSLTGYGGGLPLKRWLLNHEGAGSGSGTAPTSPLGPGAPQLALPL
jgi:methylated-DNA-[protein]-cysteine S-methyltransferase